MSGGGGLSPPAPSQMLPENVTFRCTVELDLCMIYTCDSKIIKSYDIAPLAWVRYIVWLGMTAKEFKAFHE
jgi:hypothetical protein